MKSIGNFLKILLIQKIQNMKILSLLHFQAKYFLPDMHDTKTIFLVIATFF